MAKFEDEHPVKNFRGGQAEIREEAKKIIVEQRLGVLASTDGATPHASIIGFAAAEDLSMIYFVTPRATRKFANLLARPEAALLIDNRGNRIEDFHRAGAVTVYGTVEETSGGERETALAVFTAKHPHLAEFARSPSCAVCVIRIRNCRFVNRFQQVTEINFA